MERIRKPFQGISNIIRFNWHFYIVSILFILLLGILKNYLNTPYNLFANILTLLITIATLISLIVSFYIYDLSGFYKMDWLETKETKGIKQIINIHAGFDETSILLKSKFPESDLIVLDFYDPSKHTEISIKRARRLYHPYPNTICTSTFSLPVQNNHADIVFVIFAAHEIRDNDERNIFFTQLKRILKPEGQIIVMEHLRDLPNFLAYNVGFFHFMPRAAWVNAINHGNLKIVKEIKFTPFITTFILEKYGTAS